jgi:hypothetical protein
MLHFSFGPHAAEWIDIGITCRRVGAFPLHLPDPSRPSGTNDIAADGWMNDPMRRSGCGDPAAHGMGLER